MIIFSILKKVVVLTVILILCFFLIPGKDHKKEIFAIVQDNQSVLRECVDTNDYEKARQIDGIEEVNYHQAGPYTEFFCFAEGIVPSGASYGFYYSPDDTPLGITYAENEKLEPDEGGFIYHESDGDNWYYTERILKNWYYYEEHI